MDNWTLTQIGCICAKVCSGGTPSSRNAEYYDGGTIPWLNTKEIDFNRIWAAEKSITEAGLSNSSAKWIEADTVIVAMYGATAGKTAIAKIPMTTNQACCNLAIDNSKADYRFVYYWLKDNYVRIALLANGGAQQNLNAQIIKDLEIALPPLSIQKAIADILSALDDKIDLLSQQNKTLEDLAQTYFRRRFTEAANSDWDFVRLETILETIESGSRPNGGIDPDLIDGIPSIGAESINGLGVFDFSKTKYVTREFFGNMRRGVVKSHDVLIYKDGAYVGRKAMFGNGFPFSEFAVNEHVFILRANEKAGQIFLYFLLQEDELAQLNSNSAQPGLNQQIMKAFEIVLPPATLIHSFETLAKPLIDKIFANAKQIRTLQKLRDTLLPKLISGEVRVKQ